MKFVQCLRLCHLASFDWKFLKIGTLRAKDPRKNVSVFKEGGYTLALPTLPVIRVVLLYKTAGCTILSVQYCTYILYRMYIWLNQYFNNYK